MRIALVTLAAAAAVAFAAPAFAEDQSSSTATEDNPIICKVQPSATGSRIGERRICMTKNEWTQQEEQDRASVNDAQQHALSAKPPGS